MRNLPIVGEVRRMNKLRYYIQDLSNYTDEFLIEIISWQNQELKRLEGVPSTKSEPKNKWDDLMVITLGKYVGVKCVYCNHVFDSVEDLKERNITCASKLPLKCFGLVGNVIRKLKQTT